MTKAERFTIASVLLVITIIMSVDIASDALKGASWGHLISEGLVALAAVVGLFYLLRGNLRLQHSLAHERQRALELTAEAQKWRDEASKYIEGLSGAIDSQLSEWNLSPSEKEVALLLLKGLSLKEIATIRNTTEKTARVQSASIYAKSGLTGRSELAAFFLEDLLLPRFQKESELSPPISE